MTKNKEALVAQPSIQSVKELLSLPGLTIPDYQRPYKWTARHVNQLLTDINNHRDKSSYRLGTVVFHEDDKGKNIVDGQQRTITLMLIVHALLEAIQPSADKNAPANKFEYTSLKELLNKLTRPELEFSNETSQRNIHANYLEIQRVISRSQLDDAWIDFFLNKCQVVTFTLNDISEAFQFFDSQNARGRDLAPHDLLKAYHLREFSHADEGLKMATVKVWENSDSEELADLFAEYLYRIRNWSKRQSARYFSKADVGLFKGVNLDNGGHYPYMQPLQLAHHFVDEYNAHYSRKVDGGSMAFPFTLDQTIVNGRRFFEMVAHYQGQGFHLGNKPAILDTAELTDTASNILETLNSYSERGRTGDKYTRKLFDALLMYYHDKFGTEKISRAIEKIFIWAYTLRLKNPRVGLPSIDNYALENNLFALLRDAIRPEDFINTPLPVLTESDVKQKIEPIINLFKSDGLRHYEPK